MVACYIVVALVGSGLCQLARMVSVAIGMGMEDLVDRHYGGGVYAVTCKHYALYRPPYG